MTYLSPALQPKQYKLTNHIFVTERQGFKCIFNYNTKQWGVYKKPDDIIGIGSSIKDAIQDYLWNLT